MIVHSTAFIHRNQCNRQEVFISVYMCMPPEQVGHALTVSLLTPPWGGITFLIHFHCPSRRWSRSDTGVLITATHHKPHITVLYGQSRFLPCAQGNSYMYIRPACRLHGSPVCQTRPCWSLNKQASVVHMYIYTHNV